MTVTTRMAVNADRPRLAAIDTVAWDLRSTPAPLPLSGDWAADVDLADLVVAERNGEVVAYVLLAVRHALASSAHVGLIRGLAVHPDARGQGIGRKVLDAALDHARDRGFERVVLNMLATNTGAFALYRSAGFQVAGLVPEHFVIDGTKVDDLLLIRELVPATVEPEWLEGGCHCGAVRFRVAVRRFEVLACNCSMCTKKAILHLIAEDEDFELLQGSDALSTYRFGTGVAQHTFCGDCGIHPFYTPRSHPDGWSVNARCLDEGPGRFVVRPFDGRNWEASVHEIR